MLKVEILLFLACNQLAAYAASIRGQANFLAENMNNPQKM